MGCLGITCVLPVWLEGGAELERRWMFGKELERALFEAYMTKQLSSTQPHPLQHTERE